MASGSHGRRRFSLAAGPHPRRELTLMLALGVAWPQGAVHGKVLNVLNPNFMIPAVSQHAMATSA
jgi:hypothetical protein